MDPSKMMSAKTGMIGATQQDMMWHSGGPNAPHQAHGAVSVVTTVYSQVPQRYPGAPPQSFNTGTMHHSGGGGFVGNGASTNGGGGGGPQSYLAAPPGSIAKTPYDNSYPYDHHPSQHPHHHHHHTYSTPVPPEYAPTAPQQAAMNAAQVAAAAVATATATAVAIDQSQQYQPYHPGAQPGPYSNSAYQSQMGIVPQGYGANPRMMQQRQSIPTPYMPSVRGTRPQQQSPRYPVPVGSTKGALPPNMGAAYPNGVGPSPYMNAAMSNGQAMMAQQQQQQQLQQQQRPMMQSPNGVMVQYPTNLGPASIPNGYNPRLAAANAAAMRSPQYSMQPNGVGLPPQAQSMAPAGYMPQPQQLPPSYGQHQQQQMAPMYQARPNVVYGTMTPVPNNPTPPLTPAANGGMIAPPGYPTGPVMDIKPAMNAQGEDSEPRLTLPVRDGILLQPFRLEHNAPVSQHVFILDDRTYHQLCTNPNLDLQLKCFHAEDKTMSNNWPHNANIQICVNGTPVVVRLVEKPLYIKSLCQKQKNTLQIAVQQCCCSHLFLLSLVSRPTVETMVKQLVRQRLLSPDHCIEKIRSFFHSGEAAQMRSIENPSGNADIVQMAVNMSLKCPITMKRIDLPARGQECRHPQCFDLRSYLVINKERSTWLCPICKRLAQLESLEIDQYVWGILTNLSNCDVEEVTVDGAAAWKPVVRQSSTGGAMKEENDVPCNSAKRFKPDPGAIAGSNGNVCTWSQPNGQTPPPGAMIGTMGGQQFPANNGGQASFYNNRPNGGVLSPYYPGSSPGAASFMNANPATPAACHPQTVGAAAPQSVNGVPSASSSSFSGPNTPRQSVGPLTPHNSRCGPGTPSTPMQQHNPPSVGAPPRSVGNPPSVDNSNKAAAAGLHGSSSVNAYNRQSLQLQQQSSVDASFSGSAPYTPVSVNSAGSSSNGGTQHGANNATNQSTAPETGSDFPDFTFDASDLLGSGDQTQSGASLFNNPEELMKYLADDTDFGGGFSFTSGGGGGPSTSSASAADKKIDQALFDSPSTNRSSTNGQSQMGSMAPSTATTTEFSSMDDILSFLDK